MVLTGFVPTAMSKSSLASIKNPPPSCGADFRQLQLARGRVPWIPKRGSLRVPAGQWPGVSSASLGRSGALNPKGCPGAARQARGLPAAVPHSYPARTTLSQDALARAVSAGHPAMLRASFSRASRLGDPSERQLTTVLKVFLDTPLCRQRKGSKRQSSVPAAPSCQHPAGSRKAARYIDGHQC